MKRSEALQSLSRDHHQVLALALRMRRADEPGEAAAEFLEFWRSEGRRHFRIEEEVLMPQWALLGTVDEDQAARLAREHLEIRAAALRMQDTPASLDQVRDLGERLTAHVRFEERELFVALESDLGEEKLDRLASAVAAAER